MGVSSLCAIFPLQNKQQQQALAQHNMGFAKVSALAAVGTALTLAVGQGRAQYQAGLRNLTPDGYWHNRYHALLSMAAYGDYESLCPNQTFTEENKLANFPDSNRTAWEVYGTFGPTAHGAKGFMAIIPEMNKALIIFEGNYEHEQMLTTDVVSWSNITEGLGESCPSCTANAYAVQGYLEAKEETNNFQAIREPYYNSGLVFSIAGHGRLQQPEHLLLLARLRLPASLQPGRCQLVQRPFQRRGWRARCRKQRPVHRVHPSL